MTLQANIFKITHIGIIYNKLKTDLYLIPRYTWGEVFAWPTGERFCGIMHTNYHLGGFININFGFSRLILLGWGCCELSEVFPALCFHWCWKSKEFSDYCEVFEPVSDYVLYLVWLCFQGQFPVQNELFIKKSIYMLDFIIFLGNLETSGNKQKSSNCS